MRSIIILFAFCTAILVSCGSKSYYGDPVNSAGGAQRTNNYEGFGYFNPTAGFYTSYPPVNDTAGSNLPPFVMDDSKFALVTSNGTVYVTTGKKTLWSAKLDAGAYVVAGMCADKDQNLYLVTNHGAVVSFDNSGKKRWSYTIKDSSDDLKLYTDLLAMKDGIICGTTDGFIAKISPEGKEMWSLRLATSVVHSFSSDKAGNLFCVQTHNDFEKSDTLKCISPDGKIKWSTGFDSLRINIPASISEKSIVLCGMKKSADIRSSKLITVDFNGKIQWVKDIDQVPRTISIADDGRIFVSTYDINMDNTFTNLYAFSLNGELIWEKKFDFVSTSPILISSKNLLVTGSKNGILVVYYLNKATGEYFKAKEMLNLPAFNANPAVTPDPILVFSGVDKPCMIRVEISFLQRLIP